MKRQYRIPDDSYISSICKEDYRIWKLSRQGLSRQHDDRKTAAEKNNETTIIHPMV